MRTGIIYIAVCKINGKLYVGQTTKGLLKRSARHISDAFSLKCKAYNSKFYRALRKHGKDNFAWHVLYDNVPIEKLNSLEVSTIEKLGSYRCGYNSTIGGETTLGYKHSRKSRDKISRAGRGKKRSKTTRDKMSVAASGSNNHMYKKYHTHQTKKKMSVAKKGKYDGKNNPMYGKSHSPNAVEKIKEKKRASSKLTQADVEQIRNKYLTENCTQKSLSALYGVSISTISNIVRYKVWV